MHRGARHAHRRAAAADLGLAPETQVVAGAIDNTAAAVGSGAVDDFAAHLYLGTSSWLAAHVPFKKTDIFTSLASVPCAVPGRWLLTALQATAGGNLTWLRDNVLYHQDELLAEERAARRLQDLRPDRGARAAGQQRRALHAVDLRRARPGRRRRAARRPLQPLARQHARGHRARLPRGRRAQHALAAGAGREVPRPAGRRPSTWSAAAASRPSGARSSPTSSASTVRHVRDPIQANARGAAWIAAAGLGEIAFGDVPRLVEFDGESRAGRRGPGRCTMSATGPSSRSTSGCARLYRRSTAGDGGERRERTG